MKTQFKHPVLHVSLCVTALLTSCASIAGYDQYSYAQTTSLKVDALNLMTKATDSARLHQADIQQVKTELSKIYEYEKNKPKNTVTTEMWNVLADSAGNSFGGFVSRWQKEQVLDTAFVTESKLLIGRSFDQISALESGKIKSADAGR
ncbi:hypothetical protein GS399_04965 [Pedobacter sp. HMF7647]|uniref:Lipoprotein n=1 Tax=Hufsiella arboris TaxID=2695275 RepID=A0A7K1Y6W9_9SPHI|nr:hypothetical protein [Hufsiella arboris]MXV50314.1 hypothetical protein [Hufsiella arboris]